MVLLGCGSMLDPPDGSPKPWLARAASNQAADPTPSRHQDCSLLFFGCLSWLECQSARQMRLALSSSSSYCALRSSVPRPHPCRSRKDSFDGASDHPPHPTPPHPTPPHPTPPPPPHPTPPHPTPPHPTPPHPATPTPPHPTHTPPHPTPPTPTPPPTQPNPTQPNPPTHTCTLGLRGNYVDKAIGLDLGCVFRFFTEPLP